MRRRAVVDLDVVLCGLSTAIDPEEPRTSDRIRDALLDATGALLAEQGVGGWSVEDVAGRAGVGRATVYRRFAGREELVTEAIRRDARRFFAAITESVASVPGLEDKVVAGFATGVGLARRSALGTLLARDPAAALALLSSVPLLTLATRALTERYEALVGPPTDPDWTARVEAVAEALIRLGLSFVVAPGPVGDDLQAAQRRMEAVVRPLLSGGSAPRP
ncbi:MAG: TetR/AcrR family transcriptional regulator [Actinomycetota bacterium]|nr:TetR/AcrR family transcriptional regulator [Actinomycetota bacterium]